MDAHLYLLLLCIGASFVQRVTGFGFGIFIMTWLTALMPSYGEATALSGILALCTSLIVAVRMWRHIRWNHLWLILVAFMAFSAICIFALTQIHDTVLNTILGCVLILRASISCLSTGISTSNPRAPHKWRQVRSVALWADFSPCKVHRRCSISSLPKPIKTIIWPRCKPTS